jgi:hypothetical protein
MSVLHARPTAAAKRNDVINTHDDVRESEMIRDRKWSRSSSGCLMTSLVIMMTSSYLHRSRWLPSRLWAPCSAASSSTPFEQKLKEKNEKTQNKKISKKGLFCFASHLWKAEYQRPSPQPISVMMSHDDVIREIFLCLAYLRCLCIDSLSNLDARMLNQNTTVRVDRNRCAKIERTNQS